MIRHEWQFDGLVGPTHHYAGLATGNMAAANNAGSISNPQKAALQGLDKMKFIHDLGFKQAFLPPHFRPFLHIARQMGFSGTNANLLNQVYNTAPALLSSLYSSAFMWTANAATVTPSQDSADGRVHLTVANLASHFHRSMEPDFTAYSLNKIFHNPTYFALHYALPPGEFTGDEGAANHMKVNRNHSEVGFDFFVYGKSHECLERPKKFQARQDRFASESVARLHQLDNKKMWFFQQSPQAIDAGVFHHDVIGLNTAGLMILHREAFIHEDHHRLCSFFKQHPEFSLVEIDSQQLSLADAVSTYFFNSQLLSKDGISYTLISPSECKNHAGLQQVIERLVSQGTIASVHYLDVRESMRNGGGPACLRLRVVMTPEESTSIHSGIVMTNERYDLLKQWIMTHYRDRLCFADLSDPCLIEELVAAYKALETIIQLPGFYDPWIAKALS
jgi:succinylarginine dihydrolase